MSVFADTFYWTALTSTEDSFHARAVEFDRSAGSQLITTDEVFAEYLAFFAGWRPSIRIQAANTVTQLLKNDRVRVVHQTRESFMEGPGTLSCPPQ